MPERRKSTPATRRPRKRTATSKNSNSLKRTGAQPLEFNGTMVLSATSFRPGPSLWYELNFYKAGTKAVVVQVIAYKKSDRENDIFHAEMFNTSDEAIDYIENYQPELDVEVLDNSTEAQGAVLALQSLLVRRKIDEARTEYRTLCGNVLFELANATASAA